MKKISALSLVFALLFSVTGLFFVNLAIANPMGYLHLPKITIYRSGDITPQTNYINRNGSLYTLTANDTENPIEIDCSNIVFDGAGHTIDIRKLGRYFSEDGYPLVYSDVGLRLVNVHNVTVRNVTITATMCDIRLWACSNCLITGVTVGSTQVDGDFNTITESHCGLTTLTGWNNVLQRNDIDGLTLMGGNSNEFLQNNFYFNEYPEITSNASWDDGSVGNYWSNYTTRYPNASEIGNSGIGDTPYIIETGPWSAYCDMENKSVDYHPLMYPWGAPEVAVLGLDNVNYSQSYPLNFTVSKPTQWMVYSLDGEANVTVAGNITISGLPSGPHNLTVYAVDVYGVGGASKTVYFTVAEPFPIASIMGVSAASIVVVAACLFHYQKKRKVHKNTLAV